MIISTGATARLSEPEFTLDYHIARALFATISGLATGIRCVIAQARPQSEFAQQRIETGGEHFSNCFPCVRNEVVNE